MKQTKIKDIESKYFTISDYDKFKNNISGAKITEKRLVNKSDFFRIYKKLWFKWKNKNIGNKNRTKSRKIWSSKTSNIWFKYFCRSKLLFNDEAQSFLIFQSIFDTFTRPAVFTERIIAWLSRWLSNEKIRPPTARNYGIFPKLKWYNSKMRVDFKGSCLSNFNSKHCSKVSYCLQTKLMVARFKGCFSSKRLFV